MKIAVLVKRVPDTASVFRIASDAKSVETSNLKYIINPYDEFAVSEAVKLKEIHQAEVVAVSLGPPEAAEILRTALAMGADSGLLIATDNLTKLTGKGTARLLAAALKPLQADLILAGKQAVDDDASQVPERVAELMGLPHASLITRIEVSGQVAEVDREIEGGYYTLELSLPALLTVQKTVNPPRYPSVVNIMKAKKKPIEEKNVSALGLTPEELAPGIVTEVLSLPRQERLGRILQGETADKVRELVRLLREQEKVL